MSYQPVATAEPNNGNNDLTADETFANDRDKADAKLHHKEEEHVARHHLIQQQKQPLIRLASGGDPTKLKNANLLSKSPSNSMSTGSSPNSPVKTNVSFEGAEKVPYFSFNHFFCVLVEKGSLHIWARAVSSLSLLSRPLDGICGHILHFHLKNANGM